MNKKSIAVLLLLGICIIGYVHVWHHIKPSVSKNLTKETASLQAKKLFAFNGILSQTDAHLQENAHTAWRHISAICDNPCYKKVFQDALDHERKVIDQKAVFYHSQKNKFLWNELVYTALWQEKHQIPVGNYLFMRFPSEGTKKIFEHEIEQGISTRKQWLAHGRLEGMNKDEISRVQLATNYALFANAKNDLCSTAVYFLTDFNDFDPKIDTQEILNRLSNKNIYAHYAREFKALEDEFTSLVRHSVLIQLLIPFELLNDHMYLASTGGYKTAIYIVDHPTPDHITTDINFILKTLKNHPEKFPDSDTPVFRLIVTADSVHELRKKGAEMYIYGCFDQNQLSLLINKLAKLCKRIVQENADAFTF